MANLDALFEQWLEGKPLTDEALKQLKTSAQYSAMLAQAQRWQVQSTDYKQQPVPDWDRTSTLGANAKHRSQGNTATWAVAASIIVCTLVYLVPNKKAETELSAQLIKQTKLLESQQKQIDQLQIIITAQNELQQQHMYQLTKEAIATGRVERQEDINSLINYIKTQRAQDHAYLRMQLNDIAEQVQVQPMAAIAKN
ncbi:hypothetical protein [Pseudoalteromonas sp. H105]|uniref:hypothetical protein n=1 Tax=Pseudoalteromonas sp. H105 TaxID=1348393 RepID=UPI000731FD4D|nr:hypothetical protein [Pseudoalteromonas sp. H105]KTF15259.1 hypothetical protein ATS75_10760 [Pseudoalteromonas sp. H105]